MKKLISSIILSSITAIVANAHGFWLEIDEKTNEAKFYFGDWEDNKKESGSKLERIKANVFYPTDVVKEIKRNDNHIAFSLNKNPRLRYGSRRCWPMTCGSGPSCVSCRSVVLWRGMAAPCGSRAAAR